MSRWRLAIWALTPLFLLAATPTPPPVVRAILFYSPTCGHCHHVINEVLPPLIEKYGEQLNIAGVDVTQAEGRALFEVALAHFGLENSGVPFLMVGDTYLVGSIDIPQQFPDLIEKYLAQGGTDWPDLPGLVVVTPTPLPPSSPTAVAAMPAADILMTTTTPTPLPTPTITALPAVILGGGVTEDDWQTRFARDPLANGLSVVVLAGMIFSIGGALWLFRRAMKNGTGMPVAERFPVTVPLVCILGLVVAGYLAYVELTLSPAVCGPVGDCNAVQQSEYSRLFGVLPIGLLGVLGYLVILVMWTLGRHPLAARWARPTEFALTLFGVAFSIYLTFLEPFVIGATCAWCLTSAVLMTILLWLSAGPAGAVLSGERSERPVTSLNVPQADL